MVELPKLSNTELALGGGAVALGLALGTVAVVRHYKKKRSKRKAKRKNTRKRSTSHKRKLKFGSKAYRKKYLKHGRKKRSRHQRKPHTAGKRQDTSHRRIRYTKNNQPYIILSSGKARFISKKSVSSSRKRRGGRY